VSRRARQRRAGRPSLLHPDSRHGRMMEPRSVTRRPALRWPPPGDKRRPLTSGRTRLPNSAVAPQSRTKLMSN
jgi:hypothetical protein